MYIYIDQYRCVYYCVICINIYIFECVYIYVYIAVYVCTYICINFKLIHLHVTNKVRRASTSVRSVVGCISHFVGSLLASA